MGTLYIDYTYTRYMRVILNFTLFRLYLTLLNFTLPNCTENRRYEF